ncbi:MAG: hypothetical protein WCI85_06905 [Comamonadaceae bacterium]
MSLKNLTRSELYDLVWAQPATTVAKQLDVSDVWISKVCKRANIPKPPPGYWQALAAGKLVKHPALSPQPPLQSTNMALLGDGWSNSYYPTPEWEAPTTDDQPIPPLPPPHVFTESMEDVAVRADLLTAPLKFKDTLKDPHPATSSLLRGDMRRASRNSRYSFSSEKPRFRHASGLALLSALNQLFAAWASLGATVSVRGITKQSISVNVLGCSLPICFVDYGWEGARVQIKDKHNGQYGFSWEYCQREEQYDPRSHSTYRQYSNLKPDILRSLVKESIVRVEEYIRSGAKSSYERLVERRDEVIELREKRRLAAIRRHEKEVQELIQKRLNLMEKASTDIAQSDRLRSLIAAFDEKVKSSRHPIAGYAHWRSWAVNQANHIDPRYMSPEHIGQWIAKFHLHE